MRILRDSLGSFLAMVLLLNAAFAPQSTHAYTSTPPNGTNTLAQIFPCSDNKYILAKDIADAINGNSNTTYVPANAATFNSIEVISLAGTGIKDFSGLQYLNKLRVLSVPYNSLTDAPFDIIPALTALDQVNLSHNKVTSAALPHFATLTRLRILTLDSNPITDSNLQLLPTTIVDLDLGKTKVTDAGATKIANQLPNLTWLSLEATNISDTGAAALAGLTQLKTLKLANNTISDTGAVALAGIGNRANLALDLKGNHISPVGINALSSAGFKSLLLDGQVLTDSISGSRKPIVYTVPFDAQYVTQTSISDVGLLDVSANTITWGTRRTDATFSYSFICNGFNGKASVKFTYKPSSYTVTYDDGAGGITAYSVPDEETVNLPADPDRLGYDFMGWYADTDATVAFDSSTKITQDTELHAGWAESFADSDNGSVVKVQVPLTTDPPATVAKQPKSEPAATPTAAQTPQAPVTLPISEQITPATTPVRETVTTEQTTANLDLVSVANDNPLIMLLIILVIILAVALFIFIMLFRKIRSQWKSARQLHTN